MFTMIRHSRGLSFCSICRLLQAPIGLRPQPWRQKRGFPSAAKASVTIPQTPVDHGESHEPDDVLLRHVFDSPAVWKDFNKTKGGQHVGLFRNAYLTTPEGFLVFAYVSLRKARRIVDRVLAASTLDEYRCVLQDLDRLSDLLCRVLDMADFVRSNHPSLEIQQTASQAWDMVYTYMNELNTMTGLNEQLGRVMGNPDITKTWSCEALAVAEVLRLDFSKSAINLPKNARDRFIELSSEISRTGADFMHAMAPEQAFVVRPSSDFMGLDPVVARKLERRGYIYMPTSTAEAASALRTVHKPDTRKALLYASRTASLRSVRHLEELMALRAELAKLSGFDSYSHLALRDRMMAKTPESVNQFLRALAASNAPLVKQEVRHLLDAKSRHLSSKQDTLEPWDKDYYASEVRRQERRRSKHGSDLSAYFSLGTVMQGLSRIFTRLYGIRFAPRETLPGETWHPDVRRLDVVSDTDGHVAVLYCDLFFRESKSSNPAHYTVRCSREISPAEIAEAATLGTNSDLCLPIFDTPEQAANDGMASSRRQSNGAFKQLPTIALVCDFPQQTSPSSFLSKRSTKPALLNHYHLETLFHEMGHAIHSALARTCFQNVAGTRCATDLAELPSTLMEYFVGDPDTLALFARHHETDAPLPYEMMAETVRQARRFEGCDTEGQIILAMLDQELHSRKASESGLDSTAIYHALQREFSHSLVDPPGTRWQGFFGHLWGYGSTYYSYIFDRVLADRVWRIVFKSGQARGALDRANGERLKENLLRWGGSREPWECLAEVLGEERVREGGEEAMALVGSWGTGGAFKG